MKNIVRITLYPLVSLAVGLIFSFGHSKHEINAVPYPEHLTGRFTGGFGEQTCHSCHFDYPLNFEEGTLRVEGLPETYESAKFYRFRIIVGRPDLRKAGFQLSARFPDGTQAGTFRLNSDRLAFTSLDTGSVRYVQHSSVGTETTGKNRSGWLLEWVAPSDNSSEIIFHISGNAANGDASEFGDYIMTREIKLNGPSTRQ